MTHTNPNHFAFPTVSGRGLTKREYFAAAAMQGALASDMKAELTVANATLFAVECADALIAELNKKVKS